MIKTPFIARLELFDVVGSTNDVVRGWLADGTPEVCIAVADEQSAGRGREGRTWTASAGQALLLSLGFRPTWLAPDRVWRLAAVTSLAMAEAAEEVAGLGRGTIRLKWPNDLVVESSGEWLAGASPSTSESSVMAQRFEVRKLAGVLGETDGLGTDDPRAVVGIGINADWPADEFPSELANVMTSLRVVAGGGRTTDTADLFRAFTRALEARIERLRHGTFDGAGWADRQLTNGRLVRLIGHDGHEEVVRALGVDSSTGALNVEKPEGGAIRAVVSGEIQHLRLDGSV
jgi:BirA family transcriptional regulator, biotin operon repressor / biotin---[acetyl-CoA-carboxylase] ligase